MASSDDLLLHTHTKTLRQTGQLDPALPALPIFGYVVRPSLTAVEVSVCTRTHEWKPKDIVQEWGLSLYHMGPREGTPTVSSVFTSWSRL